MPEGDHAAIFETFGDEGVIQVRVTGSLSEVKAAVRVWSLLDNQFCVRWADSNTCACAHYGLC